jgi:hypothetical protein
MGAAPVAAQGKGKGLSKGRGSTPAASPSPSADSSLIAVRQFGAWLDDATVVDPNQGYASISVGHFRALGGRQTDFPIVDAALGVLPRVQIGVSVPYYRLNFLDGSRASGLGDVYLSAKVNLIDPAATKNGFGLAVIPLAEVLSDEDPISGDRFYWGLPIGVEWRRAKYRVYGSTGYFSRGAVFGSGAVEVPLTERVVATGALVHTRALNDDPAADFIGLSKARTDVTGGAAFILTPSVVAFGSVGRTISTLDANGASLMVSAGVSVSFAGETVRGRTK